MTLADELMEFLGRFVVMRDEQRLVVALWVIHTHCLDAFEQTPYLAVTSPEKQCGKSRLLEVLEVLVHLPWMTILPSEAVMFRRIDQIEPTLLLDEVDTIFNPRAADKYEAHRALLNAGHRRGAKVPRCIGTSMEIAEFSVFCPKVLAGIGVLPDTIADRSIPIRLDRKRRKEKVDRFLLREITGDAVALREALAEFKEAHASALDSNYPDMPIELSDRMQEGTECLVAIAEQFNLGDDAREALVALLTEERLDSHETMRIRLLRDLREMFTEHLNGARNAATEDTLDYLLHKRPESPWRQYYGRYLNANDLASLLRHFGVRSQVVRVGSKTPHGYRRSDLQDVWEKYLDVEQGDDE